jgi:hypothetical protein
LNIIPGFVHFLTSVSFFLDPIEMYSYLSHETSGASSDKLISKSENLSNLTPHLQHSRSKQDARKQF